MEFIDIDSQNSEHIKLLKRFYNIFFVAEFSDENERESL